MRPVRTPWVQSFDEDGLVLAPPGSRDGWERWRFDARATARLGPALAFADGSLSVDAIARRLGRPAADVVAAIDDLFRHGIVSDSRLDGHLPAIAYFEHLRSVATFTARLFEPFPLISRLVAGPVSRRLLLGHLIEIFHFVAASSTHVGPAAARMPTYRSRTAFSEYLSSEYWHAEWLRTGLVASGLTEAQLEGARPLPGTLAQINFLRWLAESDPLAYAACVGVGEGGSANSKGAERFWQRMASYGLLPPETLGPFRDHELEDCASEHGALGLEPFADAGSVSGSERRRVTPRVLEYVHTIHGYQRDVLRFYGDETGPAVFSVL